MHENTINVKSEGGELRLGNIVDVLEDRSTETFNTKITGDFVRYVKKHSPHSEVFYNEARIYATPQVIGLKNRWGDKVAYCDICNSDQLAELQGVQNKKLGISTFEIFLRSMRSFVIGEAKGLAGHLKDLSISKVTKIKRQSDDRGNYNFAVSRQGTEKEDFQPPKIITFQIPLLKHEKGIENIIEVEFDFFFNFKEDPDKGVEMTCMIQNLQLDNIILDNKRELIENALSELKDCDLYYGGIETNKHTDDWKYKHHCVRL